jgi:hypothetical protein
MLVPNSFWMTMSCFTAATAQQCASATASTAVCVSDRQHSTTQRTSRALIQRGAHPGSTCATSLLPLLRRCSA